MNPVKNLMARYRALVRWVEFEQARLDKIGGKKSQRYLRRARLVLEVDELKFGEDWRVAMLRKIKNSSIPIRPLFHAVA